MAEVVGLRGVVPGSREPDPDLVEKLEGYLAEAKDGLIRGIAIATVRDEYISTGWSGGADAHRILAAVAMLLYRAAKAVDEE